jgi:hypothetical protein
MGMILGEKMTVAAKLVDLLAHEKIDIGDFFLPI